MAFFVNMVGIARARGIGSTGVEVITLSPFFRKIYVDDPANIFFNTSQFAENCRYTHANVATVQSYAILFDDPKVSANVGVEAGLNLIRPQFQISESVLVQPISKGDKVVIRGINYFIEDYASDGVGITTVFLRIK